MIAFLKGILEEITEEGIVVDVSGFGMFAAMPAASLEQLPPLGEEVKVYTHMAVREDNVGLYGFLTKDDLHVYRMLIGVSGIGPKAGLAILSTLGADNLRYAVLSDDVKAIAKTPGVGNKTAQKVILELKDKLSLDDLMGGTKEVTPVAEAASGSKKEAIMALTSLGYSNSEAMRAVRAIEGADQMDVTELIKQALKKIAFI